MEPNMALFFTSRLAVSASLPGFGFTATFSLIVVDGHWSMAFPFFIFLFWFLLCFPTTSPSATIQCGFPVRLPRYDYPSAICFPVQKSGLNS
ncbi:hypothetical protein HDK77DRAFT_269488 [Phyllosticta capitalensis]